MKALISYGELLQSGWDQFIRDWKSNLELSIRFLGASLLSFIATLLSTPLPKMGAEFLRVLAVIVGTAIIIHTTIVLTDVIRKRDDGELKAKHNDEQGRKLFWPFVWILLLRSLAVAGGLLVFILPGIWMSTIFTFAPLILLESGTRGMQALAASNELVKGRWWATFFRMIVSALFIGVLAALVTMVLVAIIGLFVGFPKAFSLAGNATSFGMQISYTEGLQGILTGIVQAIFIPLSVIYQVKIYHSLQKSR